MKNLPKFLSIVAISFACSTSALANDDSGVKFKGISAKEVPAEVRKTMDPLTKDSTDPFYQSQIRDGKQFYSVHYTTQDNKRMFVRVDPKGKIALGPAESQSTTKNRANPNPGLEVKREPIEADQLPAEVRKTAESVTSGGTNHGFFKVTRGDVASYVIEFDKDGGRTSALIASDGKFIEGETATANATPAPEPAPSKPAPAPAKPDPAVAKADQEAELAAARTAAEATAPYLLLNSPDQLPAEVRSAIEKQMAGGTDAMFQRYIQDGKTAYGVHFNGVEGRRNFMAIDSTGEVLVKPRKSNWQDGGKNVQFAVVRAGDLPAEVRQTIEGLGGTDHVFVQRTQRNDKNQFLVQYTADGKRMEATIADDGKLIGKARESKELPFESK